VSPFILADTATSRELPTTVTAQGELLDNGTPLAVVATLQFASGCLATMDCGFDVENRQVLSMHIDSMPADSI